MSNNNNQTKKETIKIGVVRPISKMDPEHTEQHWADVHTLIENALFDDDRYTFEIKLVSETQDSDIIQATIIQNLFESDVVICDMTLHNPNVFFELGLRIAFRKPCIIIQEEGAKPPFDVSSIRYIPYPCKLAYVKAIEFQKQLRITILNVHDSYVNKKEVSTDPLFSKAKVDYQTELTEIKKTSFEFVTDKLQELQTSVMNIQNTITARQQPLNDIRPPLGKRLNDAESLNVETIRKDIFFIIEKEYRLAMLNSINREEYITRTMEVIKNKLNKLRNAYPHHIYADIRDKSLEYIEKLSFQLKEDEAPL
nr:MAG TPA: CMP/hydroxymethyl CMP hydrolase [Caudoviricetes sp.]